MNAFQHVRSGEPVVIPAAAYNAMLDAAQAHRNRKINLSPHGQGFGSLFVHVENATGQFLERFSVVGLDGPSEPENIDALCNRITFRGVVPQEEHGERFAILQQDAEPNMIVRAVLSGVTVCKIQVDKEPESLVNLTCGATAETTDSLKLGEEGAAVLWVEPGTGCRWGIIRIGNSGGGSGTLIPVNLEHYSGTSGDATTMCSFKYYVQNVLTEKWWTDQGWGEEEDRIEVNPVELPHHWKRTRIGRYESANYGHAHIGLDENGDDILELGWINEVHDLKACV